jgi:hypothetical protein
MMTSLLRGILMFKHGLSYSEGTFRTPYINPALAHTLLIINEKGYSKKSSPIRNLTQSHVVHHTGFN